MGIGFAPNRELYTEHFLKPLRSAFSERDLQVIIDLEDDNHHYGVNIYVYIVQFTSSVLSATEEGPI